MGGPKTLADFFSRSETKKRARVEDMAGDEDEESDEGDDEEEQRWHVSGISDVDPESAQLFIDWEDPAGLVLPEIS